MLRKMADHAFGEKDTAVREPGDDLTGLIDRDVTVAVEKKSEGPGIRTVAEFIGDPRRKRRVAAYSGNTASIFGCPVLGDRNIYMQVYDLFGRISL